MRTKNSVLKLNIKEYINSYYRAEGRTPSFQEIGDHFGINKTTAYRYILEMNDDGSLSYSNGEIVTDVVSKCNTAQISAPIVGEIACGDPTTEEANIEEYVTLPESIFGNGDFYLLRAKGDSMIDAGINPGDLIVVDKVINYKIGDIVVALDENNENTLKRYDGNKNGKPVLSYMNEKDYPGKTVPVEEFICQGVVKYIIKSL